MGEGPYDVFPGLLGAFAVAGVDPYTVATWLATGQDELDGRSTASLLADPTAAEALRRRPSAPQPG